jgi:hypothetical protein
MAYCLYTENGYQIYMRLIDQKWVDIRLRNDERFTRAGVKLNMSEYYWLIEHFDMCASKSFNGRKISIKRGRDLVKISIKSKDDLEEIRIPYPALYRMVNISMDESSRFHYR